MYDYSVWISASAECLNVVRLSWFGQCVVASESGASGTYGFTYKPPPSFLASPFLSAHLFPSPPCLQVGLSSSKISSSPPLSVTLVLFPYLTYCIYWRPSVCTVVLNMLCVKGYLCREESRGQGPWRQRRAVEGDGDEVTSCQEEGRGGDFQAFGFLALRMCTIG